MSSQIINKILKQKLEKTVSDLGFFKEIEDGFYLGVASSIVSISAILFTVSFSIFNFFSSLKGGR